MSFPLRERMEWAIFKVGDAEESEQVACARGIDVFVFLTKR